jgi:hypothetical protein
MIGAGSTLPSSQARCYELNYYKLFHGKSLTLVHNSDNANAGTETDAQPPEQ